MNILVTGANGFVGSALIESLLENKHHVTALVRHKKNQKNKEDLKWIEGDLLRPESLPEIKKFDRVYYLVHGLRGAEEDFEYQESLAAVNFIHWVQSKVSGIIYLGGLAPHIEKLSPHLRSRNLTGAILASSGIGTIEFRASIILGEGSSSFEMIKAISERLPFRPDFSLLNKPCQPLALGDLLKYLENALELEVKGHKIFEIGGPEITNYGHLLDLYAELSGLKRMIIKIPDVEIRVLMKILDYAIPEHAEIGKKLAESLEFPTVVTNARAKESFPEIQPRELRIAMDMARANSKTNYASLLEKDFLKKLLSDKILTQSGLLTPELLKNIDKFAKLRDVFTRKIT